MFNYDRILTALGNSMPNDLDIGNSERGSMTDQSFCDYIANVFYNSLLTTA